MGSPPCWASTLTQLWDWERKGGAKVYHVGCLGRDCLPLFTLASSANEMWVGTKGWTTSLCSARGLARSPWCGEGQLSPLVSLVSGVSQMILPTISVEFLGSPGKPGGEAWNKDCVWGLRANSNLGNLEVNHQPLPCVSLLVCQMDP